MYIIYIYIYIYIYTYIYIYKYITHICIYTYIVYMYIYNIIIYIYVYNWDFKKISSYINKALFKFFCQILDCDVYQQALVPLYRVFMDSKFTM